MYSPALANCTDKLMVQTTALAEGEPVDRDTFSGSSGGGGVGGRDPPREVRDHRLRVVVMAGVEALTSSVGEAQAWYEEQMAELSQEVGTGRGVWVQGCIRVSCVSMLTPVCYEEQTMELGKVVVDAGRGVWVNNERAGWGCG